MTLSCLLVDDEPLALDILEGYVRRTPFLMLAGRCLNAFEADDFLHHGRADLLMLDIEMPDWSGMEFARSLKAGPLVVFTTAYDRYALEGYKADAVDYLLKPVSYDEFLAAARKAAQRLQERGVAAETREIRSIFVKTGYKRSKIDLSSVMYIEGMKDYVKIHLRDQREPVTALVSMKTMAGQLPPGMFMRVHRSFIINLAHITSIEKGYIRIGRSTVPLADTYRDDFMAFFARQFVE